MVIYANALSTACNKHLEITQVSIIRIDTQIIRYLQNRMQYTSECELQIHAITTDESQDCNAE